MVSNLYVADERFHMALHVRDLWLRMQLSHLIANAEHEAVRMDMLIQELGYLFLGLRVGVFEIRPTI